MNEKRWHVSGAVIRSCHHSCIHFFPLSCETVSYVGTVWAGQFLSVDIHHLAFCYSVERWGYRELTSPIQRKTCVKSFEKKHTSRCPDLEGVEVSNTTLTLKRTPPLIKELWSAVNLQMILANTPQVLLCWSIFFAMAHVWERTISNISGT